MICLDLSGHISVRNGIFRGSQPLRNDLSHSTGLCISVSSGSLGLSNWSSRLLCLCLWFYWLSSRCNFRSRCSYRSRCSCRGRSCLRSRVILESRDRFQIFGGNVSKFVIIDVAGDCILQNISLEDSVLRTSGLNIVWRDAIHSQKSNLLQKASVCLLPFDRRKSDIG